MKTDPRLEKNSASVRALDKLLQEAIDNPASYAADNQFIAALKSQGALAKFSREDAGIAPSSINTIKRIAEDILADGFQGFDARRTSAADAIGIFLERSARSGKRTKAALSEQIDELKDLLQIALQDCWHLTMAINKSFNQGLSYARDSNNPIILEKCLREQKALRLQMSLCKRPALRKED
ncbi:hypothetical protein EDC30_103196 [Paucimonas lemoignei]|uniref:Uncharacterized protein n=1 Tax=Paucimonas lemoignei TaxID=29443 RepID=A0A4R3HYH1_PAULE|nr:hypothetical protein [Paucimonas lemoignei]TCS37904.1 hypothetical protein EDC30_103196 [Paucimonas lemoignei]